MFASLIVISSYSVTSQDQCYLFVDQSGFLRVAAYFMFHYDGVLDKAKVNFTANEDAQHNTTSGYVLGSWMNDGYYSEGVGLGTPTSDLFGGKTVTITITIQPTGFDYSSADNQASVTMYVPDLGLSPDPNQTIKLPCTPH